MSVAKMYVGLDLGNEKKTRSASSTLEAAWSDSGSRVTTSTRWMG